MNTNDQISTTNQQAVELSYEWIQRLREVQSVAVNQSENELPEIVIATIPHVEPSSITIRKPSPLSADAPFLNQPNNSEASGFEWDPAIEAQGAIPASMVEKATVEPQVDSPASATTEKKTLGPAELLNILGQHVDTSHVQIAERALGQEDIQHLPIRPSETMVPKPLLAPTAKPTSIQQTDEQIQHRQTTQLVIDEDFFLLNHRQTSLRINRLIDRILEKIPPVNATSICFGDSSNLVNTTFVTIQTAVAFSRRDLGPVLLIDADQQSEFLSRELCSREKTGFLQLIRDNLAWQNCVYPTSIDGFDFMPVGQPNILAGTNPTSNRNNILRVLSEIKQRYRYVCICAGNLHQHVNLLTAAASDATYLVVDLQTCDQDDVKKITGNLSHVGARTLGCISTEI